jgi:uncharacterized protein YjbI with pentapeptide repeats
MSDAPPPALHALEIVEALRDAPHGVVFRARALVDQAFGPVVLRGLRLEECALRNVDFSNADAGEIEIVRSRLVDCRFAGVSCTDADFCASEFVRCSFRGGSLSGANLALASFVACDWRGANVAFADTGRTTVQDTWVDASTNLHFVDPAFLEAAGLRRESRVRAVLAAARRLWRAGS